MSRPLAPGATTCSSCRRRGRRTPGGRLGSMTCPLARESDLTRRAVAQHRCGRSQVGSTSLSCAPLGHDSANTDTLYGCYAKTKKSGASAQRSSHSKSRSTQPARNIGRPRRSSRGIEFWLPRALLLTLLRHDSVAAGSGALWPHSHSMRARRREALWRWKPRATR